MSQAKRNFLDLEIDFSSGRQFVPIELDFIELDSVCDQEIYLQVEGKHVLYRAASLPFRQQDKNRLESTKIKTVFIAVKNERDLRAFYEKNLSSIIENDKIDVKKKASILYSCAIGIAHDVFDRPHTSETISSSRVIVENTIRLLGKGQEAFVQMVSLSGHDYYTYTHCVNVLTFSIALLSQMGNNSPRFLKEVGMGALMHDIGKSKVPAHILNKPGKLTEEEWAVMKQHPLFGIQIVEGQPIPERGLDIIVQHHEKRNGTGYPYGLSSWDIPIASQAVSLVDAYDAMTTDRVYQKAMKPFEALRVICTEMKDLYDMQMVEAFIKMLNLKK
jgi:putative nucleotidyltransferase with HDIG domain